MAITFDPAKRQATLDERGLDFNQVADVFAGRTLTFEDLRFEYGETRYVTVGFLLGRMMIVAWTPRGEDRHVFSLRKANAREQARYTPQLS